MHKSDSQVFMKIARGNIANKLKRQISYFAMGANQESGAEWTAVVHSEGGRMNRHKGREWR